MRLDIALPNGGTNPDPRTLVEIGVTAEQFGFGALWALDHLLVPAESREQYGAVLDPIVLLSHLAARTTGILLGTSVIVLPMRSPFVVAKQAATIDQLSGGRFILGVGVGWNENEFANVHASFRDRGRRFDEAIALFRHLFSGSEEPFQGQLYGYDDGVFGPLPVRRDRLPLMIGGRTDAALRRAARVADIWQATGLSPEQFQERAGFLRREADGRAVEAGARVALRGSVDEMQATVASWQAAGADHLALSFPPADGFLERMREFIPPRLAD